MSESPLEQLLRHIHGFWGSSVLAAGIRYRVFNHIAEGADTPERLSERARISLRGCRAVLDGLVALGMLDKTAAGYANVSALAPYLLSSGERYLGGYADVILATLSDWARLPDSVATGKPIHRQERADPGNTFWESLVLASAPLSHDPALTAARRLGVADKPGFRMLDVGGGAGVYCATWLGLNSQGHCTQIDWPNVNAVAQNYVAASGHGARFETIDGDMEQVELAPRSYDYIVYANVAHGLSPSRNLSMLRRMRTWLRADGALVIAGLIPGDDGTGHPLALMAAANLLLNSEEGAPHRRGDYETWLHEAGFATAHFEAITGLPFTLIYAS